MRKNRIKEIVAEFTLNAIRSHNLKNNGIDAFDISQKLGLDRANVSRELNALWKNGEVIKILGRPVLFLDYQLIRSEYPTSFIPSTITASTTITEYISKVSNIEKKNVIQFSNSLENILGYNGSLKRQIKEAVAAISYPPYGLPILLSGNPGTGKRKFAQSLYFYSIEKSIKNEDSQFIVINCSDFTNEPNAFARYLLGTSKNYSNGKTTKGKIDASNNGVIYLDGIQSLSFRSLSLLIDIINNASYTKLGENKPKEVGTTFIASIVPQENTEAYKRIAEFFPVIIQLPDFDKRPTFEKLECALGYFCREAKSMKKTILINRSVLFLIVASSYKDNESQFRNEIKSICSLAYIDTTNQKTNTITVNYNHLPNRILSINAANYTKNDSLSRILNLYSKETYVINSDGTSGAYDFFKNVLFTSSMSNLMQFIAQFNIDLNKINSYDDFITDTINVLRTCDEDHLNEIRNNLEPTITNIINKQIANDNYYHSLTENQKVIFGLSLILQNFVDKDPASQNQCDDNEASLYSHEYTTTLGIKKELIENRYRPLSSSELTFISHYLHISKAVLENSKGSVLVICHSESIAKQLCDSVKEKAEKTGVQISSLDIREQLQFNDVLELTKIEVNKLNTGGGVVVLVDRQPLDGLQQSLREDCYAKVNVLPSVSLTVLEKVIDDCAHSIDVDAICLPNADITENVTEESRDDFFDLLIRNVLSKTLVFVNPKKACDSLRESLRIVLENLHQEYTAEIAVKYVTHGVHMIERILKQDPLPFYRLKRFVNNNYHLINIISHSLEGVENTFDMHVPECELAYLAEIFLENTIEIK